MSASVAAAHWKGTSKGTLEGHLTAAREQVGALQKGLDGDAASASERLQKALEQLAEIEAEEKADERAKARPTPTDLEARIMKMAGGGFRPADGGFRPADNVQSAADTATQVITAVSEPNGSTTRKHHAKAPRSTPRWPPRRKRASTRPHPRRVAAVPRRRPTPGAGDDPVAGARS